MLLIARLLSAKFTTKRKDGLSRAADIAALAEAEKALRLIEVGGEHGFVILHQVFLPSAIEKVAEHMRNKDIWSKKVWRQGLYYNILKIIHVYIIFDYIVYSITPRIPPAWC